jgi:uncharacterized membrane protein YeaQ/YmgE (transglycosylase-associated protein family)
MIGAIILGLVAGAIARLMIKNDAMELIVGTDRRGLGWTFSPG